MYTSLSNEFKSIHANTGRTFYAKIVLSSGTEIPNSNCEVLSLKLSRGNSSADDITFGDVSSSVVESELSYHSSVMSAFKDGMTVNLHIGLQLSATTEYVPMGEFKVISFKRNGEKISLSIADKLYDSDTMYHSTLTFPNTANNVVLEICNDLGINGFEATGINLADMKISAAPVNLTKRQMLSYIASYFGRNAYVGRNGKLVFGWYDFTSPVTVTDDEIETPTLGDAVNITALACATDKETVITSGNGRALTIENPYMTQSRLNSLRRDISYVPCEIKQLVGSILLDYDVLKYGDSIIPVMSSELQFDGGVSLSVKAVGKTAEEAAKKQVTPLDILVEQVKQYADDAIKHTTDIMNGINGGYKIERYDADGNPYATLWMDAPTEKAATHCIMINNEGIGFGSKNSGATAWTFKRGWLIDGTFNTDFITAHELSLTGSLKNAKNTKVNGTDLELNYELSDDIQIPTVNGNTFDAVGLKLYSEPKEGVNSKVYYTNWGAFFDASEENSALTALVAGIMGTLGSLNFYGGNGFYIADGEKHISGRPDVGFVSSEGFRSPKAFNTEDGFYVNNVPCLTECTGVINKIRDGYMADCNYPAVDVYSTKNIEHKICVEIFNKNTLNLPFEGSVGYVITLNYFSATSRYTVQFGIRYRDNQIKVRSYNKVNENSDGTNFAWSNWSETFVTSDVTDEISENLEALRVLLVEIITALLNGMDEDFKSEYDTSSGQGYETSMSGVITQWGTATVGTGGAQITFEKAYKNNNYSIVLTPYGSDKNVWYTSPTASGVKIFSSKDNSVVNWIAIGI